jgi:hypothetical protein
MISKQQLLMLFKPVALTYWPDPRTRPDKNRFTARRSGNAQLCATMCIKKRENAPQRIGIGHKVWTLVAHEAAIATRTKTI